MKLSEIITRLEILHRLYGDLPVFVTVDGSPSVEVNSYDIVFRPTERVPFGVEDECILIEV